MEEPARPPDGRLLKVHPPEGAEDETSIDIIAIHGLGTTTPRTWDYTTRIGAVNWLGDKDMLPNVVPSARIYTFSWNANYFEDAPVTRILNVAEILLSNLQRYREENDSHSRPLIFVASCFGGLIVTKALEIANIHDSAYRKLLIATSGVVFLGSPLQGTHAATAAQWYVMISGILGRYPSQTLLQDLDGSTKALRETTHRFVNMGRTPPMQMMTMCFWETRKSQMLKAVLPAFLPKLLLNAFNSTETIMIEEDSATITGHDNMPLDASHSMMNKFSGPNDANFGLVSDAIKNMVKKAEAIAISQREGFHLHNEYFMVFRRPNPLFTGRVEGLKKLKHALCPSLSTKSHITAQKIYVIYGMGGAGKSEVVVKFAHDNRTEFWGIFWIDGRSKSSITNGFAAIARMCGHPDESLEGGFLWLQNLSHSWLLILDNADNKDLDLAPFLPAGRNGSILITTRLTECTKHQTVGEDHYERLDPETAVDLLLKASDVKLSLRSAHEKDARNVVELLGCHALAVTQAGAAVSQKLCSLAEYKQTFLGQRQALLECFPGQARSEYGGVYATFEVSAAYLEARNDQIAKDSLQLLNFYAFMHFSDFPEVAFEEAWKNSKDEAVVPLLSKPETQPTKKRKFAKTRRPYRATQDDEESIRDLSPWHVSHLPDFMHDNPHDTNLDKMRLRRARSLLESLSLVTFEEATMMTRMHPVSHFWSRDRLHKLEGSTIAMLNGLSVLSLSIKNPWALDVLPLSKQLQSHIESIAYSLKGWDDPTRDFHLQQSIYRLGFVMYRLSCGSALFEFLQMIQIQTDRYWIRSRNSQKLQLLHSHYMMHLGDASKAVTLLEQIREALVQVLAPNDPEVMSSQHELAVAYLEIEDTTKAINLLEQIVETRKETLGPEHEDLLLSQHELAFAYLQVEETAKAISLLEEVAKTRSRTFKSEHPGRVASQQVLAGAYLNVEETGKAITLLEEVVEINAKTLRPQHPDRLASQHTLAVAYLKIGETDKATALLESVAEIQAKTLRADHPKRVRSIYVLAQCHCKASNYERALGLARSIEDVARNRQGDEIADWNAELIGIILGKMGSDEATNSEVTDSEEALDSDGALDPEGTN